MRILSFQFVNSEKITGIMEEESCYFRFYLLCNGDKYIRRIPTPGPMKQGEFREFHRKLEERTNFHRVPVEIDEITYDNLREIYRKDVSLHVNEPIGGFPEPKTPHPDLATRTADAAEVTGEEKRLLAAVNE